LEKELTRQQVKQFDRNDEKLHFCQIY